MTEGADERGNRGKGTRNVAPNNADSFKKSRREFVPNTDLAQEENWQGHSNLSLPAQSIWASLDDFDSTMKVGTSRRYQAAKIQSSALPLSSGTRNRIATISSRKTEASRAIAARKENLAASAPTTNGPGAPTARPRLNKRFCAVARAAVGYASDKSAPIPAMWLTENPMMPPTQSSSIAAVTLEYKNTVQAAAIEKITKTGLRPIRSAS